MDRRLKDWALTYVKSRDAVHQAITGIEDSGLNFIVRRTIGDQLFMPMPDLSADKLPAENSEQICMRP